MRWRPDHEGDEELHERLGRMRDERRFFMPDETTQTQATPTEEAAPTEPRPKKRRGFACMPKEKVSAIASKGGKAAHAAGTAHQFTTEEAREAGRRGGVAPHVRRGRGVSGSST